LYFVGSSHEQSGVYTQGLQLFHRFPGEVTLVLFDSPPKAKNTNGILDIPIDCSHLPRIVVSSILDSRVDWPSQIFILPNNSACGYEVARELYTRFAQIGSTATIVGVIHSNVQPSLDLVIHNGFMIDKLYSVSDRIKSSLASRMTGHSSCKVIHYPISKSNHLRTDRRLAYKYGPIRLIFVGRLVEDQKKFSRVIRLVKELKRARASFRLSVIGDGHLMQNLLELKQRDSNITEDLIVLGEQEHEFVLREMNCSDVLILTSEYEGSPLVVMEAMSVGAVPVVMDYGPEVKELITHGENGYVVGQGRIDEMAETLCVLEKDRTKLFGLSDNALKRASKFTTFYAWRDEICQPATKRIMPYARQNSSYVVTWERIKLGVKKIQVNSKLLIWGGGHIGRLIVDELISNNHQIDGCVVIDRILHKYLPKYRDVPYYSSENLPKKNFDIAIVASEYYAAEIQTSLEVFKREHNPNLHITAVRDWR
jgi:glycosyltransferase involved in cell wall biosynthesis